MEDRNTLGLRPLTARSIVLSTLLGTHPARLPVRALIRAGELFGVAEGTIRVALSRMVAAGDLAQDGGRYQLTARLLDRQARQDESRAPRTRPWDGSWETCVITAERRPAPERAALRQAMTAHRLAELREGVWLRPANLDRPLPAAITSRCLLLGARPSGDPARLAADLWDLGGWAGRARALVTALDRASGLAEGFMVSAAVLRHLLADPLLPPELAPPGWPGEALRARYDDFDRTYRTLLHAHLTGSPEPVPFVDGA
ncbi:PaaX family transcriptional regulator C-terminal domain-containing protein [Bailinhaonella thermotolerans]|uniref:PaaX domain-containing protein, C-domain protein n=1 Tax=Bailinhaonella thermotolerans TaxID=1070861 RepID=A0A3A4B389_9ACTN|nr:PaaX family transcriptional regulator C-terminal domain-containing protein [Bailinhaonella thermotolerans]RJL32509.1 PaaX domain-containing protein, C- domain protein [Bailinhaonella thermotolerans]